MEPAMGICVVEDSPEWLRRFKLLIAEIAGTNFVGSAASPSAALELISELLPSIILLDLNLVGGSGVDVLKSLYREPPRHEVVVVTGSPSERLKETCLGLGARFFFDKALEIEKLPVAIETLLQEASGAQ